MLFARSQSLSVDQARSTPRRRRPRSAASIEWRKSCCASCSRSSSVVGDVRRRELRGEALELGAHSVSLADVARASARGRPRRGSARRSTRPFDCSLRSASRTGVRLTPNSAASDSWRRRVPVGISPLSTRAWIVAASRSTRPWVSVAVVIRSSSCERDCVAHEPDGDTAEEQREDDAQRVPGQREREQRAGDAAHGAERPEAQREPEVADALAVQRDAARRSPSGARRAATSPAAACCETPAASVRNGTIMIPPPTPSSPAAPPGEDPERDQRGEQRRDRSLAQPASGWRRRRGRGRRRA